MGIDIISVGSQTPWWTKVSPPVTRGLEGWFCFDTDISRIAFNRAPGKPDAKIVGTPTIGSGYARFKGNTNFLETYIKDLRNATLIAVCKLVATPSADDNIPPGFFIGSYRGTVIDPSGVTGTADGVNLYVTSAAEYAASASYVNASNVAALRQIKLAATPVTQWALRAMRVSQGGAIDVMDLTTGTKFSSEFPESRALNNNYIRIGSANPGSSAFGGESDISNAIIASAAWSDIEIAAVAPLVRKRAARFGILV